MTSQFDLTRFYDVIIRNLVFQLGFLTREFQIPVFNAVFQYISKSLETILIRNYFYSSAKKYK